MDGSPRRSSHTLVPELVCVPDWTPLLDSLLPLALDFGFDCQGEFGSTRAIFETIIIARLYLHKSTENELPITIKCRQDGRSASGNLQFYFFEVLRRTRMYLGTLAHILQASDRRRSFEEEA